MHPVNMNDLRAQKKNYTGQLTNWDFQNGQGTTYSGRAERTEHERKRMGLALSRAYHGQGKQK
jgi:hypothetical protein